MDFAQRMRQLANIEKKQRPNGTQTEYNNSKNYSKRKSSFSNLITEMSSDGLIENYIATNPQLKKINFSDSDNASGNEIKKNPDFFQEMASIAQKAANKPINESSLNSVLNPDTSQDKLIEQKIKEFQKSSGMLNEQPPSPLSPPAEPPPDSKQPETTNPPPPPPPPPQSKPDPESPEPEPAPDEQEKAAKKKGTIIANAVQAVSRLSKFIDWGSEADEKVNKLTGKAKKSLTNDNPVKNPFNAISILLNSTDFIPDAEWQEVLKTNYKKYIVGNPQIEEFLDNISRKVKVEVEKSEDSETEEKTIKDPEFESPEEEYEELPPPPPIEEPNKE